MGLRSVWGLSPASPKTSLEVETHTRMAGSTSRAAASSVAVAVAIAATVSVGSSHESGTKVGAARW